MKIRRNSTQGASLLVRSFFIVVAGLCLSTNVAVAQVFSTEDHPVYQYLFFNSNSGPGPRYLQDAGNGNLVTKATGTSDATQWIFVGTPDKFYIKSKSGNYLAVNKQGSQDNNRTWTTSNTEEKTWFQLTLNNGNFRLQHYNDDNVTLSGNYITKTNGDDYFFSGNSGGDRMNVSFPLAEAPSTADYDLLVRFTVTNGNAYMLDYGIGQNVLTGSAEANSVNARWQLVDFDANAGKGYLKSAFGNWLTMDATTGLMKTTANEDERTLLYFRNQFDGYGNLFIGTKPDRSAMLRQNGNRNTALQPIRGDWDLTDPTNSPTSARIEVVVLKPQNHRDYRYRLRFTNGAGNTDNTSYANNRFIYDGGPGERINTYGNSNDYRRIVWTLEPGSIADNFKLKSEWGHYVTGIGAYGAYSTTLTAAEANEFQYQTDRDFPSIQLLRVNTAGVYQSYVNMEATAHNMQDGGNFYSNNNQLLFLFDPGQTDEAEARIEVTHRESYLRANENDAYPQEFQSGKAWQQASASGNGMQKVSEMKEIRYVKPGDWVPFYQPTTLNDGNITDHRAYQRVFNYDTDGAIDYNYVNLEGLTGYYMKNGFVTGVAGRRGNDGKCMYNNDAVDNSTTVGDANVGNLKLGFIGNRYFARLPENGEKEGGYIKPYRVGIDMSRYSDYSWSGDMMQSNMTEPSLTMRWVCEMRDANKRAAELTALEGQANGTDNVKWLEEKTVHFPEKTVGFYPEKIGMTEPVSNLWVYDTDGTTLINANTADKIVVVLEDGGTGITLPATGDTDTHDCIGGTAGLFTYRANGYVDDGTANNLDFTRSRFVTFKYPNVNYLANGNLPSDYDGVNTGKVNASGAAHPAYIKVYVKNGEKYYRVAKFKIIFEQETTVLPNTDILNEGKTTGRSLTEMNKKYTELANITFDYPKGVQYVTPADGDTRHGKRRYGPSTTFPQTVPMPLDFSLTSYAFDSNGDGNPAHVAGGGPQLDCNWGSYSIMNDSKAAWGMKSVLDEKYTDITGYVTPSQQENGFLFIDASETPGSVCQVPFSANLCSGKEIHVTGWFACVNSKTDNSRYGGSVVLTLQGHTTTGWETVYMFCPGQLAGQSRDADGVVYNPMTGGDKTDGMDILWQQFYFHTTINKGYDSYRLDIDNNCVSSAGGDYLLDNIRVFAPVNKVELEKNTQYCGGAMTVMKLTTSTFSTIMQSKGENDYYVDEDKTVAEAAGKYKNNIGVYFAFLDKEKFLMKFRNEMLSSASATAADRGVTATTTLEQMDELLKVGAFNNTEFNTAYKNAFVYALLDLPTDNTLSSVQDVANATYIAGSYDDNHDIHIGHEEGSLSPDGCYGEKGSAFTKYVISNVYKDLTEYTFSEATKQEKAVFAELSDDGKPNVVFNVSMAGHNFEDYTDYYVVFNSFDAESISDLEDLFNSYFNLRSLCTSYSDFHMNAPFSLLGDDATEGVYKQNVCAGQIPTITINDFTVFRRDADNDGEVITKNIKGVNFDWWVGNPDNPATIANFNTAKDSHDTRLIDALEAFRGVPTYVEKTSLEGVTATGTFTQAHLNCLKEFVDKNELILHSKTLSGVTPFAAAADNNNFCVVLWPIHDSEFDTGTATLGEGVWSYCDAPQGLKIGINDRAPEMKVGLVDESDTKHYVYPTDLSTIYVRLAKRGQFETLKESKGNHLFVPLRSVVTPTEGADRVMIKAVNPNISLVYSDDAEAQRRINESSTGLNNAYPVVGQVVTLQALEPSTTNTTAAVRGSNVLELYFADDFEVKEGYEYWIRFNYIEAKLNGTEWVSADNACDGQAILKLKIVPDYEIWTGDVSNPDWNNDGNWRRADFSELYAENSQTLFSSTPTATNYYRTNENNGRSTGYAPLYCTRILMKKGEKILPPTLYDNGYSDTDGFANLNTTASELLRYDMQTHRRQDITIDASYALHKDYNGRPGLENDLIAELYQPNTCDQIVFQPQTEMVNAHLLNYNKAWVEYELKKNDWQLLASPLQGMISGEWYAPRGTARQATTYFEPVTFNTTDYDHSPAVYQRGWDKAKAVLYEPGATWSNLDGVQSADGSTMPGSWVETQTGSSVYNWVIEGGDNADEYLQRITYKPFGQNKANVAVKGTWSNVFNDHSVKYDNGGFSVMVINDLKVTDANPTQTAIFRLPKEDTFYEIWNWDQSSGEGQRTTVNIAETESNNNSANTIVVPNRGKLRSDGMSLTNNLSMTLSNEGGGSLGYFLCGNPFVCGLDMDKFFVANTGLERNYRQYDADGNLQTITVEEGSSHIVEPGQAFFIKQSTSAGSVELNFTTDMMTAAYPLPGTMPAPAPAPIHMVITAERGQRRSSAVVTQGDNASNMFVENEDVETFIDENIITCPTVYTLCGRLATTVNRLHDFRVLPVGIESNSDDDCMLTFNGVEALGDSISLYDAVEETLTPLTEGYQVSVPGRTYGRYYIVKGLSLREAANESCLQIYTEGNRVTVVSLTGDPIRSVNCVDVAGRLLHSAAPQSATYSFDLSTKGVYIIDAQTKDCHKTKKMMVKY